MDDRIRHEVEWHAGKLELKAKISVLQVEQSLIKSAYPDIQGPFEAEGTTTGVWEIRREPGFLKTISLGMRAAGS
jgi:hypothetical protein